MGNKIFLDSNLFIALLNQNDSSHVSAVRVLGEIQRLRLNALTSNFVISEVITVLSQRVDKNLAISFADAIYRVPSLQILTVDRTVELMAIEYLKRVESKNVSFCDCTIFAILELLQVPYLATFDKDFKKSGTRYKIIGQ